VQLLRSISHERGAAVVLVTHDAEAAAVADRNAVLRDGLLLDSQLQIDGEGPGRSRSGAAG
jgi:ABC-type lipoprotein export system ATPase subunit